jgi:hypothetical protein
MEELMRPLLSGKAGTNLYVDSTTAPPAIIQGLRGDGFEVSSFHPSAVMLPTYPHLSV